VSTLTGAFDLTEVTSATLRFRTWYDLQRDYDYGFVSVSTDNGTTWRTLAGRHTTTSNPAGANYGHGYTSISGAEHPDWLDEMIDLSSVVGHKVLLRFSTVIDDAVHHPGMLVDDIRIPELDFADDAEKGDGVWQARGWIRTDNALPQRWQLRLVHTGNASQGDAARVEAIPLDADNRGKIELDASARAALVVMATTPHTTERARYSISPAP